MNPHPFQSVDRAGRLSGRPLARRAVLAMDQAAGGGGEGIQPAVHHEERGARVPVAPPEVTQGPRGGSGADSGAGSGSDAGNGFGADSTKTSQ